MAIKIMHANNIGNIWLEKLMELSARQADKYGCTNQNHLGETGNKYSNG
jgi:hypothetical protein